MVEGTKLLSICLVVHLLFNVFYYGLGGLPFYYLCYLYKM